MNDRHELQAMGTHPAPCARHCEANAFQITLKNKDHQIRGLINTMKNIQDGKPAKLYHATTQKKAKMYRETGHINAPVRGFTTKQAAMAWAMKVGQTVILEFEPYAAHKLPDHHNEFGQAWWNDGNIAEWRCVFSAHGEA